MKVFTLLVTILALLAAGCARREADRPRIGIALRDFDDPFRSGVRKAAETESVGRAELSVADAMMQQTIQNGQVESFIARKARSLAVDLAAPEGAASVIARAKDAKTPVVFLGRLPGASAMTSWDKVYYVGSAPEQAGASAGAILASAWKSDPRLDRDGDGSLDLAFLAPLPEGSESSHRLEGAMAKLASSGVTVRRVQESPLPIGSDASPPAGGSGAGPRAVALVAEATGAEAILCDDAATALAAVEALASSGRASPGGSGSGAKGGGSDAGAAPAIPIVAAGSSPAALERISGSLLLGAVADDAAEIGAAVFRLALVLARGQDASAAGYSIAEAKYVWIPCKGITAANIADGRYR